MVVFGTRPEAIKLAGLIQKLKYQEDKFETKICITAQQREMLDQALQTFELKPDIDLNIMQPSQNLAETTSRIIVGISNVISSFNPDILLVHGDTSTAMASSIASFYHRVDVGHIEAGLRTFNLESPFPEEFNRQIVSKIAKWHFAPTESSKINLLSEGVSPKKIEVTGNTAIDTLKIMNEKIKKDKNFNKKLTLALNSLLPFPWSEEPFILVTGHRRENFGAGFQEICKAINEISNLYPQIHIIYSLHLNPDVREMVINSLSGLKNVHLVEPLNYEHFVVLLSKSMFIITDSGGIQEEAPFLGKPVLVMRGTTERPEALDAGTARLVGTDSKNIVLEVIKLLEDETLFEQMSLAHSPYGDGMASDRIIKFLEAI